VPLEDVARELVALKSAVLPRAPEPDLVKQIADYIRDQRETGDMEHVVQVFDVLASQIEKRFWAARAGAEAPPPEEP
jgi:hypothetical protein